MFKSITEFLQHYAQGMSGQIAQHAIVDDVRGGVVRLIIPSTHRHLLIPMACDKLHAALSAHVGQPCRLLIEVR